MRYDLVNLTLKQLFKIRLHLGNKKNNVEENIISYIYGSRNNITILDLKLLLYNLKIVQGAIIEIIKQRGFFYFIHTKNDYILTLYLDKFFKKYNKKNNFNILGLIHQKWVNGLFSNWNINNERINNLKLLKHLNILRKKDILFLDNLEYLHKIKTLILPDLIFLFNYDSDVIKEMKNLNIPLISITDNKFNFNDSLYALIGNTDNLESTQFFCQFIENSIQQGQLEEQELFLFYFLKKLKQNIIK